MPFHSFSYDSYLFILAIRTLLCIVLFCRVVAEICVLVPFLSIHLGKAYGRIANACHETKSDRYVCIYLLGRT